MQDFTLSAHRREGPEVILAWDASPYGMGGMLQINKEFKEFFAIGISKDDEKYMATEAGSSVGQQTWEGLCGLICLRLWSKFWQAARAKLRLRNDNVGALTLFAHVKGRSPAHTLLARELALDLGRAQCRPDLVEHLPGVTNKVCDVLSRRYQPGQEFVLPRCMLQAKAVVPPARNLTWWKTLSWAASSPATPQAVNMGEKVLPLTPVGQKQSRPRYDQRDQPAKKSRTQQANEPR